MMDADIYQEAALRSESIDIEAIIKRFNDPMIIRTLHSILGLTTETGEFADVMKRHLFYGKEIDDDKLVNILEELGDISWYVAIGSDAIKQRLSTVFERNIAKLAVRYPEKFSESKALARNLEDEDKALRSSGYGDIQVSE